MRRADWLLLAAVLLAALALFLVLRPGEDGAWAVVTVDGAEVARYPLNEDRVVTLGDGADYNILEIRDGGAAVTDASCGDRVCVRTGTVRRAGESIVCLPHRLVVSIEGGDAAAFDAVAR